MWYSATSGHVRTEVTSNRSSKKLKKFIIILDNETLLYLPGSFLSGSVLVELDNDTPVLEFWMTLLGNYFYVNVPQTISSDFPLNVGALK
ncbi:hypothetical protein CEXT_695751 [Caerostris extrusa]|uniref:Uncharacterized protein n=1 Tax=Caerostris extrusa TaxID=172846 RepID=A0AAV4Q202_CAEEX|nr:hypothetical protein CEXT_695751 [Caerostris extrusa]